MKTCLFSGLSKKQQQNVFSFFLFENKNWIIRIQWEVFPLTFSEAVKVCQTPKAGRNRGRKSKIVFVLIQAKNLPELNANCKKQDFDLNSTSLHKAAICGHPFLWNKVPEIEFLWTQSGLIENSCQIEARNLPKFCCQMIWSKSSLNC